MENKLEATLGAYILVRRCMIEDAAAAPVIADEVGKLFLKTYEAYLGPDQRKTVKEIQLLIRVQD